MKNSQRKFLLIRTDRLGDVILTTPAISLLRQHFSEAHLAFMTREYTAPLLQNYSGLDTVMVYRPEADHRGMTGIRRLAEELRASHFTDAFLFYPRPELALALWLAGIPARYGIGYRWYSPLLNHRIYEHRKYGKKHELEYNLSLLQKIIPGLSSLSPAQIRFDFRISEKLQQHTQQILKNLHTDKDYLILHTGSGGSAPNLTQRQYRLILNYFLEHTDWQLLLTGNKAEIPIIKNILKDIPASRVKNAAGLLGLDELLGVIARSRLFISSSTGPLHLANALNIPVLAFYCPAVPCSPKRWGPYHQSQWVVAPDLIPCKTCNRNKCPHGNCLEKIQDAILIEKSEKRLAAIKTSPQ